MWGNYFKVPDAEEETRGNCTGIRDPMPALAANVLALKLVTGLTWPLATLAFLQPPSLRFSQNAG